LFPVFLPDNRSRKVLAAFEALNEPLSKWLKMALENISILTRY
jgi:hypothetical protein